jgi:hypothetical protein
MWNQIQISIFRCDAGVAFGSKGAPPLIPGDSDLDCEIELHRITPPLRERYKAVGKEESIKEELLEKVNT